MSDNSIDYDRNIKIPLYAKNQICEVWLVDLNDNCVEIYQKPNHSDYQNIQKLSSVDTIILSNFPNVEINISELFWLLY